MELEAGEELEDGVSVAGATDLSELVSTLALVLAGIEVGLAELEDTKLEIGDVF